MPATDKPFNNQRTLDIVFAVSNILMLLSVVWMFVQDYNREYKTEQRAFRDVEVAMALQTALESLPSRKEFDDAEGEVKKLEEVRDNKKKVLADARAELIRLRPAKEKAEAKFQEIKADVESYASLRDIAIEHGDTNAKDRYERLLEDRNKKLVIAQAERDGIVSQIKAEQFKIDEIEGKLTKALAEFKKVNDRFDAQVKLALSKRWGFGDWLRTQPVINAFADPLKIQQFTINDIPIDYNFKQVTRFDRCTSCHLGIDRPTYTRENLMALTKEDTSKGKLDEAIEMYKERIKVLDDKDKRAVPNPGDLGLKTLSDKVLTPARITEFAAHPRLDLYVGSSSKHPAEKFGCTSCHSGQGSGTSFSDASHSPNSIAAQNTWTKERGWEFNHMWDFPMHATRFVESSCLKCHHEVTDLISTDNRVEAPKLLRGYNLIRENGCFGCHEINGWKSGVRIGPDIRVEPSPPLEFPLSPEEIDRAQKDTDNRPGTLRKVGPSLARVSEKLKADWIEKWLASPSSFRPDTKMPHYYGLSNNKPDALPDDQKKFPAAEMASIAHFLTKTSERYLADAAKLRNDSAQKRQEESNEIAVLVNKGRLDEKDQARFVELKSKRQMRTVAPLEDLAKGYSGDKDKGRILFIERGCLACHTHQGTEAAGKNAPPIHSVAEFGPNLTQIAEKQVSKKWLVQWIIDPHVHSPRSRMPVTHVTPEEAADIAAWLLSQPPARDADDPWHKVKVEPPSKNDLQDLVRVYLVRMLSKKDTDRFLAGEFKDGPDWDVVKSDITKDEVALRDKVNSEDDLKMYLGKKAVARLGCFGCHDIPGFENTKSIGVGLNDWGKKPPDRLAFEDIKNFFEKHYYAKVGEGRDAKVLDSLVDQNGMPYGMNEDGKEPYEAFYADLLIGHFPQREGYLNQKIRDPRSYDFNRIRAWDDRARMPQFHLARPRKKADEKEGEFKARIFKEEAEAREAVANFVLGLVAEQVPSKSINHPSGDRRAEVKGRQVLDKYNCAGCHTIRPGVYDFKPGEKTLEQLEAIQAREWKELQEKGEIVYLNHHNWVGRNPLGVDQLTAYGVQPILSDDGDVILILSEALRFVGKDKTIKNVPASVQVPISIGDLSYSSSMKTQADFDRAFQASAPFGGRFADLMVPWLIQKDENTFKSTILATSGGKPIKDSPTARASLPPLLIGQGERTQPDWLYKFLLNPQPVRRMTILRMPKFNMSQKEAQLLVDYFAAVSRQTNPGIGLSYPNEIIPPREDLNGPYWRNQTELYVLHLKNTKDKDGKSLFDGRVEEYKKAWEQIRADEQPRLKASIKKIEESINSLKKQQVALEKALKEEKDGVKKAAVKEKLDALTGIVESVTEDKKKAEETLGKLNEETQKATWRTQEAYAGDAYRLLLSRELCSKCHQIGGSTASQKDLQGPPLDMAFERLRPDWIERWVNKPQRFVPYTSLMPPYFNRHEMKYQDLHAGSAQEQIHALRDALLNYPRLSNLPINRVYDPNRPAGK
jgi:cbb3-type cytochrome oxidase cytochrome c subunit